MSWTALLAINLTAATVRETLNKAIANRMDPTISLFYIQGFSLVWLYLLQVLFIRQPVRLDLLISLPAALFVAAFVFYLKALKISLSQSILFQSYSILVTVLLSAVFLGETKYLNPSADSGMKVLLGIIFAMAALWLLLHTGRKKEEVLERRWFLYIGATIFSLGAGSFFSVLSLTRATPVNVMINQGNMIVPLYIIINVLSKKSIRLSKKNLALTVANSLAAVVSVFAFFKLIQSMPVAKLLPLQQVLLVIIMMTVGIVVYPSTRKLLTSVRR